MDPRTPLSPNAISPGGPARLRNESENNFAVLNSSLLGQLPDELPDEHHLASYVTAKRTFPPAKEKRQHRIR
ncbi:uncharacterized protein PHACADRAFT_191056 [Phanerochaete carnosa HHB-10118-sp]|uniref:Uncharacterized protein n=1 Tax=Phanerochaete carnosa (strain HHB-10118-sp) TaxID=650164 RepID=K5WQY3_PHACS|nr:uncharacterized protein PHACADRAFT_191056 [Phanerochaete carnosa HHB-10118-sp]EKM61865.1 hypothetical protein PHACADRAFT_191056 [Phanerochaete carnosa HHB-10118-sp]